MIENPTANPPSGLISFNVAHTAIAEIECAVQTLAEQSLAERQARGEDTSLDLNEVISVKFGPVLLQSTMKHLLLNGEKVSICLQKEVGESEKGGPAMRVACSSTDVMNALKSGISRSVTSRTLLDGEGERFIQLEIKRQGGCNVIVDTANALFGDKSVQSMSDGEATWFFTARPSEVRDACLDRLLTCRHGFLRVFKEGNGLADKPALLS